MNNILVSIDCITYNHEKYIAEALESFLMQETNFKFEILIYDDASTDRTADIIKEYQKKYPDIIKSILQKENQMSKGAGRIGYKYNHTRANGKYIAICEGDDYWVEPYKLQKQVDYMESHPNCSFCFHNAELVDARKNTKVRKMIPMEAVNEKYYDNRSRDYSAGEMQLLGFIPTASFMYSKFVLDNPPNWFFEAPAGDIATKLIASSSGYAHYIDEVMSVYRINVKGSLMYKWSKEGKEKRIIRDEKYLNMFDSFNDWTNGRYLEEIDECKKSFEISISIEKNEKLFMKDLRYKEYFESLRKKEKTKLYIKVYIPRTYQVLFNIKRYIKGKL